jgi:hypothetical protein
MDNNNEIMNNSEVMDTEIEATQADESSSVGIGYIVGGLVTVGLAAWKLVDLGKAGAKKIKAKLAAKKAAKEAAVEEDDDFIEEEIVEEEK